MPKVDTRGDGRRSLLGDDEAWSALDKPNPCQAMALNPWSILVERLQR
jgi:hypothetical protein